MKALFASLTLLIGLSAHAGDRSEKVLLTCSTQKWSSVELLLVKQKASAGAQSSFLVRVSHAGRVRESVGVYTESETPVFFTDNAAKTHLHKNSDGSFVLTAEFSGTQPMNVSAVKLIGTKNAEGSLDLKLADAKPSLKIPDAEASSNSFEFFLGRWNEHILKDEVVFDTSAGLTGCNWVK